MPKANFLANLGLNFRAINLKFSQIVGHEAVRINSSKIEVRSIIFIPRNVFHILDRLGLNLNALN